MVTNCNKERITNACAILDISIPYSLSELKKCYYKKALQYHPDKNTNDVASTEKFQGIVEVYEILSIYIDDL